MNNLFTHATITTDRGFVLPIALVSLALTLTTCLIIWNVIHHELNMAKLYQTRILGFLQTERQLNNCEEQIHGISSSQLLINDCCLIEKIKTNKNISFFKVSIATIATLGMHENTTMLQSIHRLDETNKTSLKYERINWLEVIDPYVTDRHIWNTLTPCTIQLEPMVSHS